MTGREVGRAIARGELVRDLPEKLAASSESRERLLPCPIADMEARDTTVEAPGDLPGSGALRPLERVTEEFYPLAVIDVSLHEDLADCERAVEENEERHLGPGLGNKFADRREVLDGAFATRLDAVDFDLDPR